VLARRQAKDTRQAEPRKLRNLLVMFFILFLSSTTPAGGRASTKPRSSESPAAVETESAAAVGSRAQLISLETFTNNQNGTELGPPLNLSPGGGINPQGRCEVHIAKSCPNQVRGAELQRPISGRPENGADAKQRNRDENNPKRP
jgi:hypothetical protein